MGKWNNLHSKSNTHLPRDRNKQEWSLFDFFDLHPIEAPVLSQSYMCSLPLQNTTKCVCTIKIPANSHLKTMQERQSQQCTDDVS